MQKTFFKKIFAMLLFFFPLLNYAANPKQKTPPPTSINKQVGVIQVQFDLVRVVVPNRIVNANNPTTWRAYLPTCPPGSQYVSGVQPNLLPLDQAPRFAYCNCVCLNQCSQLPGVSSTGGKIPLYTARVTCAATIQGWFDSNFIKNQSTLSKIPHRFTYCQFGNCETHPLPAELHYTVPTGGYANTQQINFQACMNAYVNHQCALPDPSAIGKQTVF